MSASSVALFESASIVSSFEEDEVELPLIESEASHTGGYYMTEEEQLKFAVEVSLHERLYRREAEEAEEAEPWEWARNVHPACLGGSTEHTRRRKGFVTRCVGAVDTLQELT